MIDSLLHTELLKYSGYRPAIHAVEPISFRKSLNRFELSCVSDLSESSDLSRALSSDFTVVRNAPFNTLVSTTFSQQAVFVHTYAPRPFFFPVGSIIIPSSGLFTILNNSRLSTLSLHTIQVR